MTSSVSNDQLPSVAALGDDLAARIARVTALAATPGYDAAIDPELVDVEAWNHVGDPLAEALITELRERKLMGGDIYANARALESQGVTAAVEFFADVEHVPAWVDFEAMRLGADMGRRNPIGMLMGLHGGLPFTYIDPATARVMAGTGRLAKEGGDFRRRFWETATGFVGALDVDGMKPGGPRWEQWVRIRMLHTMIRLGIHRSGHWDYTTSMPISQVATAAATHIFGPYRVAIIRSFGGLATQAEDDSFSLMWRWISRIEGVNVELLGATHADQRRISERMHQYLYAPETDSRSMTEKMITGLTGMRAFRLPRRAHSAIVRRVLTEDMVQTLPGRDVAGDLGLRPDRPAELAIAAATTGLTIINQAMRIPAVRTLASRHGQKLLDTVVDRGLDRMRAEYRATPVAGAPD
ncbi:oxygenase MpaB family protein [Rhodococcus tibetensis]|uniref:Oxygenase MpaB family protein n=1 Tax=Rhodococcus tibetensis TaxID=2965064 RepID=A0ABT1QAI3_9NOCA|nr:oxygenase MpaB family protein [Rhodococcus sp. FXJ9.536]MCQ4118137.1 oxygenase MpaB family protein [Rhodococcus sp. FXJ9.536]